MRAGKIIWMMVVSLIAATTVHAQSQRLKLQLNYGVATPTGSNFKEFISNTSFRGGGGSLLYGVNDKISVGLSVGYQDFYQKYPRQVYKTADGSDLSAVVTNSLQTMPLLLEGQYNFLPTAAVQPYVALGIGGNLVTYRQFAGEFENSRSKFGFAARPEAGIQIPVGVMKSTAIVIGAQYNYMPFNYNDIKNLNSFGVNAGVRFALR